MIRPQFNNRLTSICRVTALAAVALTMSTHTPAHADAVMGTYAQPNFLVADGNTVYTAWVYADNSGLNGQLTWGAQYDFFLPPYATLIPGGLGTAFGKPDPARDFFDGNPMIFETLSPPGIPSGRLVNQSDQVSNNAGDLQFYRFTINTNAPIGLGNFDLGPNSALTDPASVPQPFTKQNIPFTITALPGDLTLDSFVGIDDLNTILGNWNANASFPNYPTGDVTGDRFVGIDDLNWVLSNWNNGTPPPPVSTVPEPTTATLLAFACTAALRRNHRHNTRSDIPH
jgi:hypothetical protein